MGFQPFTELENSTGSRVHAHLRDVFRFCDDDASAMVNQAMRDAGFSGDIMGQNRPCVPIEFTSHRAKRHWQVRAMRAAFCSYTIVSVVEVKR
jgi:hypothetical protein